MHESHVWGIRSNEPSRKERYQAAIIALSRTSRKFAYTDLRLWRICYNKACELLDRDEEYNK